MSSPCEFNDANRCVMHLPDDNNLRPVAWLCRLEAEKLDADKKLFEKRWNDVEEQLARLSKGLYDRMAQGSPLIQANAVDTALALIDRLRHETETVTEAINTAVEADRVKVAAWANESLKRVPPEYDNSYLTGFVQGLAKVVELGKHASV